MDNSATLVFGILIGIYKMFFCQIIPEIIFISDYYNYYYLYFLIFLLYYYYYYNYLGKNNWVKIIFPTHIGNGMYHVFDTNRYNKFGGFHASFGPRTFVFSAKIK